MVPLSGTEAFDPFNTIVSMALFTLPAVSTTSLRPDQEEEVLTIETGENGFEYRRSPRPFWPEYLSSLIISTCFSYEHGGY